MTAEERIALINLKIERADQHIGCLESTIKSFVDSNPYKVGTKRDPETRKLIYYVESVQPVPVIVATIAGDALHCLRDALDHLAQQLYLVGSGNANGYRDKTSFPVAQSAKKFKAGLAGKVEGMRQDAIDAICALEPYAGGKGSSLWTFHRLNNIDKHRLIITVGSAFNSVDIGAIITAHMRGHTSRPGGIAIPAISLFIRPADKLFPLEAGKELLIGTPDEEPNENVQFRFDIAVHEPGLIDGEPIIPTLMQFRDLVKGVVESFRQFLS
jgi:hypothetical protein